MTKERIISVDRLIAAPANEIFDLLADPDKHRVFDGSDTVVDSRTSNPARLSLGARFGMSMRLGVPYRITNEVVEFEEDRLIAWRHFGHHIWRYELKPDGATATLVTESFEWGTARVPKFYEWVGYPAKHLKNIETSLERLAVAVEAP